MPQKCPSNSGNAHRAFAALRACGIQPRGEGDDAAGAGDIKLDGCRPGSNANRLRHAGHSSMDQPLRASVSSWTFDPLSPVDGAPL